MSSLLASLAATIAVLAQPFADAYAASATMQTGAAFLHFAGLLTGGGFAIASDRAVWRASAAADELRRAHLLEDLDAVHRPVLVGLGVVFLTGFVLTLADVETYLMSIAFWSKMGLVALLLGNGWWLGRLAHGLRAGPVALSDAARRWRLLRASSAASLTLWLAVTLAGVILTNG